LQKITEEDRKKYDILAQQDSLRYHNQRSHYLGGKKAHKPKRSLSAYIRFANDIRENVKKDYPTLKITELMSKIGERWNKLDANAKSKYQKLYEEEKEKLSKEKENKDATD